MQSWSGSALWAEDLETTLLMLPELNCRTAEANFKISLIKNIRGKKINGVSSNSATTGTDLIQNTIAYVLIIIAWLGVTACCMSCTCTCESPWRFPDLLEALEALLFTTPSLHFLFPIPWSECLLLYRQCLGWQLIFSKTDSYTNVANIVGSYTCTPQKKKIRSIRLAVWWNLKVPSDKSDIIQNGILVQYSA